MPRLLTSTIIFVVSCSVLIGLINYTDLLTENESIKTSSVTSSEDSRSGSPLETTSPTYFLNATAGYKIVYDEPILIETEHYDTYSIDRFIGTCLHVYGFKKNVYTPTPDRLYFPLNSLTQIQQLDIGESLAYTAKKAPYHEGGDSYTTDYALTRKDDILLGIEKKNRGKIQSAPESNRSAQVFDALSYGEYPDYRFVISENQDHMFIIKINYRSDDLIGYEEYCEGSQAEDIVDVLGFRIISQEAGND